MGSGASSQSEEDIQLFRALRNEYESKKLEFENQSNEQERDKMIFNHLRTEFVALTSPRDRAMPKTNPNKNKPHVGGIVVVQMDNGSKQVEALINASCGNDLWEVEFPDGTIEEIHEDRIHVMNSWDILELHDLVKVKDIRAPRYFEAEIVGIQKDGTYTVQYDDEETEDGVVGERILKIFSARSRKAVSHWQYARRCIAATNFIASSVK